MLVFPQKHYLEQMKGYTQIDNATLRTSPNLLQHLAVTKSC